MAVIKVTRGGCGIKFLDAHGNARHALKTPENDPFECDDAQAGHLVSMGVAAYVGQPHVEAQEEIWDEPADEPAEDAVETVKGTIAPEAFEAMTIAQLQNLAGDMGIDVSRCKKKADYVAVLSAVEVEAPAEDDSDDDLPDLSAADPE